VHPNWKLSHGHIPLSNSRVDFQAVLDDVIRLPCGLEETENSGVKCHEHAGVGY
jgi:hypothetical protein